MSLHRDISQCHSNSTYLGSIKSYCLGMKHKKENEQKLPHLSGILAVTL